MNANFQSIKPEKVLSKCPNKSTTRRRRRGRRRKRGRGRREGGKGRRVRLSYQCKKKA